MKPPLRPWGIIDWEVADVCVKSVNKPETAKRQRSSVEGGEKMEGSRAKRESVFNFFHSLLARLSTHGG